jgi:subtilisin family serine protease
LGNLSTLFLFLRCINLVKYWLVSGTLLNMILLRAIPPHNLKTRIISVFILTAAVMMLASCGSSGDSTLPPHRSGEVIIKFRSAKNSAKIVASLNARKLSTNLPYGLQKISLPTGKSLREALAELNSNPEVLYAEPNYIARKSQIPNDPRFSEQWGMTAISAPQAWDVTTGSSSIIVATLDTGIDYRHPDLVDNLWLNSAEIPNNGIDDDGDGIIDDVYGIVINGGVVGGNPWDDDFADTHGTHVAGIIGATGNNAIGVSGVNWRVRLMAIKFLHGPLGEGDLADAVTGMAYAVGHGAKVINCSFEVPGSSRALAEAIGEADKQGVLVVSAAGNSGNNIDHAVVVPASIRTANNIAVAATTQNDTLPSWSNFGQRSVDLAAPGGMNTGDQTGILSTVTLPDKNTRQLIRYRTTAGTSMSAPHVSGVAALVWSAQPHLSHYQVRARIMNGVDKLSGLKTSTITGGRLNALGALTAADIPAIFSVQPAAPARGETITISGVNFGSVTGSLMLADGAIRVTTWSDTTITAVIPETAIGGTLLVNVDGSGFPVEVAIKPIAVSLSATPTDGAAPLLAEFTATASSPDSELVRMEWDFGDGFFAILPDAPVMFTASRSFGDPGSFTVRVRATDKIGRSAVASAFITVTAGEVAVKSSDSDNRCFIATAAYGSPLHPRVAALRSFRDRYLLTNSPGRWFVAVYYRYSPPLARLIAGHDIVRAWTRIVLYPLFWVVERGENVVKQVQ